MTGRAGLLAFTMLFVSGTLAAQQVNVAANVPVRSPTGAGVRNLAFGMITPVAGTDLTVDVAPAVDPVSSTVQSGEFRYDVTALRGLDFTLTVPSALTLGTATLPVSFAGSQYGGYCVTAGVAACSLTAFNPAATGSIRVCHQVLGNGSCRPNSVFPAGSELAIYIGGLLTVPPAARAGVYTGTITLTIIQVY